ncbi:uncharacterized protein [Lolium perenne]|uniref:uncharacterized protein isoform X8 n=1 Tax=Lolium perenne TaxID=4522 RepID=UPI003A98DFDC
MFAKNHCGEDRVRLGLECFRCVLPTCVQETRFERFGGREDFFIGLGSAGRGNQFDYVRSRVQDHGDFSGQTRTYGSPRKDDFDAQRIFGEIQDVESSKTDNERAH